MGGAVSSIFGMNNYSAPDPVQYVPTPDTRTSEVEEQGVRDAERRRLRARAGGVRATLLNNPLNPSGAGGVLGRPGPTS